MKTMRFFEGQTARPILDEPVTRKSHFYRVVRRYWRRHCPIEWQCCNHFAGDMCCTDPVIDDPHDDPNTRSEKDLIEELRTVLDAETNWPAGRMDMILGLVAAERGLTIPSA